MILDQRGRRCPCLNGNPGPSLMWRTDETTITPEHRFVSCTRHYYHVEDPAGVVPFTRDPYLLLGTRTSPRERRRVFDLTRTRGWVETGTPLLSWDVRPSRCSTFPGPRNSLQYSGEWQGWNPDNILFLKDTQWQKISERQNRRTWNRTYYTDNSTHITMILGVDSLKMRRKLVIWVQPVLSES